MRIRQVVTGIGVGVVGALLVGGAAAWACTESSYVSATPSSGPADSRVTVTGGGFASGPVEVRWNSSTGPVLASPNGPNFSVAITVPAEATPDVYYIVALQSTSAKSSAPFEVTSTTTGSSSGDGSGDGGRPASRSTSGSTSGATEGPSTGDQSASGSDSSGSSGIPSRAAPVLAEQLTPAPASAETPTSAISEPSAKRGVSNAPAEARDARPLSSTSSEPGTRAATATSTLDPAPSPRSATADVWAGFDRGSGTFPTGPGLDASTSAAGSGFGPGAGLVGAAIAAFALLSGFGVADMRRRRMVAVVGHRQP